MFFTRGRVLFALISAVLILTGIWVFMSSRTPEEVLAPILGPVRTVVGKSVQGREIEAVTFGTGSKELLFIGGIHGGYEWNSVVLAYDVMDYLKANPSAVPENLKVTVIPSLNPDGVFKILGKEGRFTELDVPNIDQAPGRFNANGVDLNRNFPCRWSAKAVWRNKSVGAGSAPFSEPEAVALKNFIESRRPIAVIYWHSQSGTVYSSECENGPSPETLSIMNVYAKAAGYKVNTVFEAYTVTGDAEGWTASLGIPALTVELTTHDTIEFEKNLAGVQALMARYATQ